VTKPITRTELIQKITTRLEDPNLSHILFAKLSQQLLDLRFDAERRVHRSKKWVLDRAKALEEKRHMEQLREMGIDPTELDLTSEIAKMEAK
jgi:hypothetical protein